MPAPALRSVDLNLLVAFAELSATGSVTLAAQRLGLTQSAMSRTLARLRDTFADPLFVRAGRGLRATPRAEQLAGPVGALLQQAETVLSPSPRFEPSSARRTFVISSSDYADAVLLPRLLELLANKSPGVSVRIAPHPGDLAAALERGDLDLAWTPHQSAGRATIWNKLFDEGFGFVLRRGHPALRYGPLTLKRYLALRHIAIAPTGRSVANPLDDFLARLGERRSVAATVSSFLAVPLLVERSDLGAVLPKRVISSLASRFTVAAMELPFAAPGFSMHQAWHERVRKDPGHAWLRQQVLALAKAA